MALSYGQTYCVILVSLDKRLLLRELSTRERLEILERLESFGQILTPEAVAKVEPICDKALLMTREIMKLDAKQALDVYAKNFPAFAALNPSLLDASAPSSRDKAAA